MTLGQWPWKSESAKECVTTHLTNAIALKINGAESIQTYKQSNKQNNFMFICVSLCDAFKYIINDMKNTKIDLVSIMH